MGYKKIDDLDEISVRYFRNDLFHDLSSSDKTIVVNIQRNQIEKARVEVENNRVDKMLNSNGHKY